ncbi:hypothetical protein [Legionella norrlandica]|nr:hypothetical protein [Legionella norrlandica]
MFNLRRIFISILLVSFSLLTACHTVKGTVTGAQKDIKTAGKAISSTLR